MWPRRVKYGFSLIQVIFFHSQVIANDERVCHRRTCAYKGSDMAMPYGCLHKTSQPDRLLVTSKPCRVSTPHIKFPAVDPYRILLYVIIFYAIEVRKVTRVMVTFPEGLLLSFYRKWFIDIGPSRIFDSGVNRSSIHWPGSGSGRSTWREAGSMTWHGSSWLAWVCIKLTSWRKARSKICVLFKLVYWYITKSIDLMVVQVVDLLQCWIDLIYN